MCGVVAFYNYHYAAPAVNMTQMRKVRDYMHARGPDAAGEWMSHDQRVAFGHRRLSIIDLSERANQPLVSQDKRFVVSFNGEIYNYKQLKKELQTAGKIFTTDSDTEVILQLYAEKGVAMLNDLRGMFAFSIWDALKQELLIARDAFGVKPLYYANDGWSIRVASQVKALKQCEDISNEQDAAGMIGFWLLGSVPEPYTRYVDIRAVPAGSYLRINCNGVVEEKPYFSMATVYHEALKSQLQYSKEEAQITIREALLDSVRHHLVADVPVGAFLSSGIDSASLIGLMRDAGQSEISTVTLAFSEYKHKPDDEAPLAQTIARFYGVQHHTRYIDKKEFMNDLPEIMQAMDQPSIDGINSWYVSKAAKELGLKVAISGLGGDEFFGGYPSFRKIPKWNRWLKLPSSLPLMGEIVRHMMPDSLLSSFHLNSKSKGMIKYGGDRAGAYLLMRSLFLPWELKRFLKADFVEDGLRRLRILKYIDEVNRPDAGTGFARISTFETSLYMRNQLLRDTDWASMAHSLEVRVPFVDRNLFAVTSSVLPKLKSVNSKYLIANSPTQVLGDEIINRPKTGFTTPIGEWIENDDHLQMWKQKSDLKKSNCHWSRKWAYDLYTGLV
ncbi:MAG: asparagine synthase (glutamine-hydrolyzing) [Gammaproteobacteria bacterium]|nr:asparagine synthase (glutamine-hydrolyzing) [Gammaproteobacteria bacterium]